MNGFVEACRREWKRIGVPDAVANEMAADLGADLAEAEADGVSAEEVLGNGVFDAPAFAASWAAGRGVVTTAPDRRPTGRPWGLLAGVAASVLLLIFGVALVGPVQRGSVAVAAVRRSLPAPPLRIYAPPNRFGAFGPGLFTHTVGVGESVRVLGLAIVLVGVAGLAVTLWLWRSRSRRADPPGSDDSVRLPSFL